MKNFTLNEKYENYDEAVMEMGRELNRDLVENIKWMETQFNEQEMKVMRKDANRQRIAALGLKLIPGGKYENKN